MKRERGIIVDSAFLYQCIKLFSILRKFEELCSSGFLLSSASSKSPCCSEVSSLIPKFDFQRFVNYGEAVVKCALAGVC